MSSESTYAKDACNHCMKIVGRDNLKSCSQCRLVRYCSRECQKAAWRTHKKACNSDLREAVSRDRGAHSMNDRLSKWINTWRNSLCSWSIWALNVNASAKDKLSTHCFVLHLVNTFNAPSPAQYFRLDKGEVIPRTQVHELLKEKEASIDEWLADERGDNTVQIVIFAEDFLRFLWFSIRDIEERQEKESDFTADALARAWPDALRDAIEKGDIKAHDEYLQMAAIATIVKERNRPEA